MTEPKTKATRVDEVMPGVWHWWVKDDRIGGHRSEAYALVDEGRVVLVDPLPVELAALRALGEVEAIVLTAGNHQRACWSLRASLGAPVYAPENAFGLEGKPDHSFTGGDLLPGRLTAFHAPGPVESMQALWRTGPVNVIFLSDLLTHDGSGQAKFVAAAWQDEPWRTRDSVRRIAEGLPVDALAFAHGPPIIGRARQVLEQALAEDDEQPAPVA